MDSNTTVEDRVQQFCGWYGDGADGSAPTADQWRGVLARDPAAPITLVNMFRFRETADYGASGEQGQNPGSGAEAFNRYAAVSMPTLARVGGRFLHAGPASGALWGQDEGWDLLVVAHYPDLEAFVRLYADEDYRQAFEHRRAACAEQKVLVG